jgi:hypothetical protein
MHHLHLVYSTLTDYPWPLPFIIVGLCLSLSVYACFAISRVIGNEIVILSKRFERKDAFLIAILGAVFSFAIFLIITISSVNLYRHDKDIYNSNQLKFAEGYVTNYHLISEKGHSLESFTINGVEFHYSGYDLGRSGYHQTASTGGVIKPNLYVRIGYYYDGDRNAILKLETE